MRQSTLGMRRLKNHFQLDDEPKRFWKACSVQDGGYRVNTRDHSRTLTGSRRRPPPHIDYAELPVLPRPTRPDVERATTASRTRSRSANRKGLSRRGIGRSRAP